MRSNAKLLRLPDRLHRAFVRACKSLPVWAGRGLIRASNLLLRLPGGRYVVATEFGAKMICSPRDLIQTTILHFRVWEPDVSSVIARVLRPGDIFVDVGANVGFDTLLAAHLVGGQGGVISIEAAPGTFAALQENIALNPALTTIRAVNKAVSDRVGELTLFNVSATNIGAASTSAAPGAVAIARVPAEPLDHILSRDEMDRVRLIKIDIEGGETVVLRRFVETLSLYPQDISLIVELAATDPASRGVFNDLLAAGFHAFAVENQYTYDWYLKWRSPTRLVPLTAVPEAQTDVFFTRSAVV